MNSESNSGSAPMNTLSDLKHPAEHEKLDSKITPKHGKIKKNLKKFVIFAVILTLGIALYHAYQRSGHVVIGEAEVEIFPQIAEAGGKILEMQVELGQRVKAGEVLAILDNTDQKYALEQLELSLEKAKISLADANTGGIGQAGREVALAQVNYESARISAETAAKDYGDNLKLYEAEALSQRELEQAKLAADTAALASDAAKAKLELMKNSAPSKTQNLNVAQLESQIAQMKTNMEKYTVKASQDGTIASKSYVTGDIVSAGTNLAEIGSSVNRHLTIYMPEPKVSHLEYGDEMQFTYGDKTYAGKIIYIDVKKQYTPKDMQTAATKNKESFKVKLSIPENCPIKAGEEATALI